MEPTQMELMLFAAGSRSCAKILASPEKAQDLLANEAASGSSISASSKKRSRATSSSKTCQPFALADWKKFSGHSLRSGMMRNGIVSPLPPLAHLTDGIESGLWRTPGAQDGMRGTYASKETMENRLSKGGQLSLPNQVKHPHLWPTPCARDWKDNGHSPAELVRNSKTLATHAGGSLNPTWVEWLMGYPCEYTALNPSETALFLKSRKSSGKRSSKQKEKPYEE